MDPADQMELRRRILKNIERFDASCLAWAFLPNHYHLLYHSKSGNLADFMRCLMSGYSIYFNRRYERSGHLFQNRYKSSVVDTERYLLELIRYIHLNPVRSGIVTSVEMLSLYPWTGHHEIIVCRRLPWERFPFIQQFFSSKYLPELEIYQSFLEEGLRSQTRLPWIDDEIEPVRHHPQLVDISTDGDTDGLQATFRDTIGRVSCRLSVSQDRILNGRRDRLSSRARREVLSECVIRKGMSLQSVCKLLGITKAGGLYLLKASGDFDVKRRT